MRHMAPAAFWRAWASWVVAVGAYAVASGYNAVHPLPAKLASDVGSAAAGVEAAGEPDRMAAAWRSWDYDAG